MNIFENIMEYWAIAFEAQNLCLMFVMNILNNNTLDFFRCVDLRLFVSDMSNM